MKAITKDEVKGKFHEAKAGTNEKFRKLMNDPSIGRER